MNTTLRPNYFMSALPVLFLVGCAPYINSYYLPNSTEGYLSGHGKLTSDEPLWILEKEGATFYFSAGRADAENTTIILSIQPLRLPGETMLSAKKREEARAKVNPITVDFAKLREGTLIITNARASNTPDVRVVKGQCGTSIRSNVEITTNEIRLSVDHFLELSAIYTCGECDVFVVEWPSMLINGKLVRVPPVRFEWKSGFQVQFVNG